jgi:hypothetical protein
MLQAVKAVDLSALKNVSHDKQLKEFDADMSFEGIIGKLNEFKAVDAAAEVRNIQTSLEALKAQFNGLNLRTTPPDFAYFKKQSPYPLPFEEFEKHWKAIDWDKVPQMSAVPSWVKMVEETQEEVSASKAIYSKV